MFHSLQIEQFRVLWIGMLFAMAAMQMNMVARAWLAYDITGSGVAIGLVALARGVPQFALAPFGGVATDRFDKRKLLIGGTSIRVLLALITAVLVSLGIIEIWHLIVIGFFQGLTGPFTMPTRTAFMSDVVGERRLANAIALDSTGRNLNRVLAPALVGLFLAISPMIAFYAVTVFYAISVVLLFRLQPNKPSEVEESSGLFRDAVVGFRYTWQSPVLLTLIGMVFFIVFVGMPYRQLLPVFQSDVLHVGESALGLMYACIGLGAIMASLLVAYVSESPRKQPMLIASGIGFGISLTLFALSDMFLVSLALLVVVGFASQVYLTLNKTLVMLNTDRALYGRVMSVYMMGFSLMPVALLPMGAFVDSVGAPATIAAAGVLLVTITIVGGFIQIARKQSLTAPPRPRITSENPAAEMPPGPRV